MSLTEEDQLLQSLYWSSVEYPLGKFLEDYTLPQVVRISEGHYGENEVTSLGTCQVLTLHALSSRKTLVADDCNGKPLTVSLDCPVKVHVYLLKIDQCPGVLDKDSKTVDVFSGARYVKALEGYMNETEDKFFEVNDILEIMEIDKENAIIRCRNMATNDQISFPLQCTTSLVPLLDHKEYTLAEVEQKFDLPAKVSFISAGNELSQSLSSFGTILLLGVTDETVVIATTVGGTAEDKVYHILQKDLDICVCVAEEILSGDETYDQIATKLHDDARVQKLLFDLDQLAVCRDRSVVHRFVHQTRQDFLDNEPSQEVRQKHSKMRLRLTRPPLAPKPKKRNQSQNSSLGQPSSPDHSQPDIDDLDDNDAYEEISDDVYMNMSTYQNSPAGHRRNPPGSPGHPTSPPALPRRDYHPPDNLESRLGFGKISSSISGSFRLPSKHSESIKRRSYHATSDLRSESIENQSRRLHDKLEAQLYTKMHSTTCTYPTDLSGLTVEEVGVMLKSLHMEGYVKTFKEELINGELLISLDEECLQSLKMTTFHCRKMMNFINGWRPGKSETL